MKSFKQRRLEKQFKEKQLALANKRLDRQIVQADVRAQFDVVSGSTNSNGGGNKRRQSRIETKEETGAQGILNPAGRLNGLNLCRDAERNYSQARSIIHQRQINIIGPSPKLQVNTGDKFGEEATSWFNVKWQKNCDFRQDRRFAKLGQLVVGSKDREGDLLAVFDDDMIKDTGKLIFFESDLICDRSDNKDLLKKNKWTQRDGIISDEWGREIGYVTTQKRGQTSAKTEDSHLWPRDPDDSSKNMARLIRADYRLIQGRGISPMLSAVMDFLDCYEMRSKELQSAKVAAGQYAYVKRKEAETDFDNVLMDPDNQNPADQDEGWEGETTTLPENQSAPVNYEALEKMTGGYTDYMDTDDEIEFPKITRPNVAMKDFLDYVMDSGGSAFGMAHAYTRLKADTSYTAFRGDMVMTWVTFYAEQKDMENEFLDWSAVRAIKWAIRKKLIKNKAPEGWEDRLSWTLPTIPFIKELEERKAHAEALKNGEISYSQLLGPDWKKIHEQLAKELKAAKELGLPLAVFETKAGGSAAEADKQENEGEDDDAKE